MSDKKKHNKVAHHIRRVAAHAHPKHVAGWWSHKRFGQKLLIVFMASLVFMTGGMYGIAQWYIARHMHEPLQVGATFIPKYARYYDLDPKETLRAIIDDLGVRRLRLVSYWDEGEASPGKYDFTDLDWQFAMAEDRNVKISLAIGLRQPRWPECHMPAWAAKLPKDQWAIHLKYYMRAVIERYKDSPALESYQLENEYFLKAFGECPDFSRERLVDEFNLVRKHDPNHKLIVSMSNNAIGTPIGEPTPDEWAISVYKRVWDRTITKRYFEYPLPAWYYAFRAGWVELTRGRNSFIHELQAESWGPGDKTLKEISLAEQDKSLGPERLRDRFEYGRATGMRTIDLWGAEYWYWRKTRHHQPDLWNVAREEIARLTGRKN